MLVIFDCDGVLVDSEPLSNGILARLLTEVGLPSTREDCMREYMGRSWASCQELIEARLGRSLPAGFGERFESELVAAVAADGLDAVPGVREALDALEAAGAATCVASSGSHEKMRATLGRTELLGRFEGRIFSAVEVPRGKPAPDLFLRAAEALNAAAADCVVVEDSPLGVRAARAAGMRVLGYAGRTPADRLEGAEIVTDMRRLPELLLGAARL